MSGYSKRGLGRALCIVLATSAAAAQDIGFEGPGFTGVTPNSPTESKPESKLWYLDGSWWGSLWSEADSAFHIQRRDADTDTWIDAGVEIEARPDSKADVLVQGTKLYVATHEFTTGAGAPGDPILFLRYDYDTVSGTYTLDPGFPVQIADSSTESLVIDRDSTGTVWAVWMQELRVHYAHTLGDDTTWSSPAILPANTTDVLRDDICSVIHFGGDTIGVMWSDQSTNNIRFATHGDGDPPGTWSGPEDAASGESDDHINLAAHSDGRVFAVVKNAADQILLLERETGGTWNRFVVGEGSDNLTRPIVVLNEQSDMVHVFAASLGAQGDILEKASSMSSISFPPGRGTSVMHDDDDPEINDPTSTKQNFNASTGLVVLASHEVTEMYWHHEIPPSASMLMAMLSADPVTGQAPLDVQFSDMSVGSPVSWLWDFGDGDTSTQENPLHTYLSPGTFTVSLTVEDGTSEDTLTVPDLIEVLAPGAPLAAFDGQPQQGFAPLEVTFTDLSTGSIDSRLWDFGDGETSTEADPVHTYVSPGTFTVSLELTGPGGTSTETKPDFITVEEMPAGNELTLGPISPGRVGVVNTLTATGATPGSVVGFIFGRQLGSTLVVRPGCPAGIEVGIDPFRLLGLAHVDANGMATLGVFAPAAAANHVFHFQVVDQAACRASNVVSQRF